MGLCLGGGGDGEASESGESGVEEEDGEETVSVGRHRLS